LSPAAGGGGSFNMNTLTATNPGHRAAETPTSSTRLKPLGLGSNPGARPGNHGAQASKLECQDQQCVEEECDPEECGDEKRPPQDDNYVCGIDRRPLLPLLLATSTVIGCIHMTTLQFPMMRGLVDGASSIKTCFFVVYGVTIACMGYCALCDPGQLKRRRSSSLASVASAATDGSGGALPEEEPALPKRAHKTWLYKMPIRRYDHYCRWLTNCIGLLNHREFITMCAGLVAIGVCGAALDIFLLVPTVREGDQWVKLFFLGLHIAYSFILIALVGPILRLHIGFISRNELANEWKNNDFYVITSARSGERVPVNDLSDDEFNAHFDVFEYDNKRNAFDRGLVMNCWTFWCASRCNPNQMGDF